MRTSAHHISIPSTTTSTASSFSSARRRRPIERILLILLVFLLLWISLRSPSSLSHRHHEEHPNAEATPRGIEGIIAEHHIVGGLGDGMHGRGGPLSTAEGRASEAWKLLSRIRNGVEFFADYDVTKVRAPEPHRTVTNDASSSDLKFRYMNENTSKYPFRWVSTSPRVALIPHFLSPEECDAVIAAALPAMQRSQVAQTNMGKKTAATVSAISNVRTSSQTWLSVNDGVGKTIADRIYDLTSFPAGSSELLQVLRYELNQKYDAHLDYFDPVRYGPQPSNRAMTVYLYLSDVEEGGHTWFPQADGSTAPLNDFLECKRGLGVRPTKGAAAVFYDMTPEGLFDPNSIHGACPVKKGVKFGGTLWFRIPTPSS